MGSAERTDVSAQANQLAGVLVVGHLASAQVGDAVQVGPVLNQKVAPTRTDELAVMVDTVRPLALTRAALELDDPTYPLSWLD